MELNKQQVFALYHSMGYGKVKMQSFYDGREDGDPVLAEFSGIDFKTQKPIVTYHDFPDVIKWKMIKLILRQPKDMTEAERLEFDKIDKNTDMFLWCLKHGFCLQKEWFENGSAIEEQKVNIGA